VRRRGEGGVWRGRRPRASAELRRLRVHRVRVELLRLRRLPRLALLALAVRAGNRLGVHFHPRRKLDTRLGAHATHDPLRALRQLLRLRHDVPLCVHQLLCVLHREKLLLAHLVRHPHARRGKAQAGEGSSWGRAGGLQRRTRRGAGRGERVADGGGGGEHDGEEHAWLSNANPEEDTHKIRFFEEIRRPAATSQNEALCGGGVPSSHPSLGLSVFLLSLERGRGER